MATKMKKTLKVVKKFKPAPGFIRIVGEYKASAALNKAYEGAYLKLLLTGSAKPVFRTFTLAEIDEASNRLSIDFVERESPGPGADFAKGVQIGDQFSFLGPGKGKAFNQSSDHYYIIGDKSAFPAMKALIKNLKSQPDFDSKVINVIFDATPDSAQHYFEDLFLEKNLEFNAVSELKNEQRLVQVLEKFDLKESNHQSIWCAGERLSVQAVRQFLNKNQDITFEDKYISSYWQRGLRENQHKALKQKDGRRNSSWYKRLTQLFSKK